MSEHMGNTCDAIAAQYADSVVVKLWEGRMVDLFIREVQPVKKERQKISVALSCDLIKQLIESEEEPQVAIETALRQYFNQSLQE